MEATCGWNEKIGKLEKILKQNLGFLKYREQLSGCSAQDHLLGCSVWFLRGKTPILTLFLIRLSKGLHAYSRPELTQNRLERLHKDSKTIQKTFVQCVKINNISMLLGLESLRLGPCRLFQNVDMLSIETYFP